MSFPPTNSASSAGRPDQGFVLGPDEGEPFWWLGSLTLNKVTRSSSQGAVDIVDHRVPAGYTPPPHVHTNQDEVFYIIDGDFAVHCGDQHWQAGPGSLVFLPRQIEHGFSVTGDKPGRTLLINAPAGFADVIAELGVPATELVLPGPDVPVPDDKRVGAVSEAHGIRRPSRQSEGQ